MRKLGLFVAVALLISGALLAVDGTTAPPAVHTMVAADGIVWGPAPPGLPPGSKAAVLVGNPGAKGSFTIRALLPDGYKIPPHWHSTVENLTVLSGILHAGMGDTFDRAKASELRAGGFASMPAEMRHWVWAEGETILQVQGEGPFAITYVDPKDDPRSPAVPK